MLTAIYADRSSLGTCTRFRNTARYEYGKGTCRVKATRTNTSDFQDGPFLCVVPFRTTHIYTSTSCSFLSLRVLRNSETKGGTKSFRLGIVVTSTALQYAAKVRTIEQYASYFPNDRETERAIY